MTIETISIIVTSFVAGFLIGGFLGILGMAIISMSSRGETDS